MATASAGTTGDAVFDTNVLVYCYDTTASDKQKMAVALLERFSQKRRLILSAQVINEFYVAVTKPTRPWRLSSAEAIVEIRDLIDVSMRVVPYEPAMTFAAIDAVTKHGLSFWDALVWAAAKAAGATTVYTEDFQHGRDIEGVSIINPFLVTPPSSAAVP